MKNQEEPLVIGGTSNNNVGAPLPDQISLRLSPEQHKDFAHINTKKGHSDIKTNKRKSPDSIHYKINVSRLD